MKVRAARKADRARAATFELGVQKGQSVADAEHAEEIRHFGRELVRLTQERNAARRELGIARDTVRTQAAQIENLTAANASMDPPPGLGLTPDQWHAIVKAALAPVLQAKRDAARLRELVASGDGEAACRWADGLMELKYREGSL